MRGNGTRVRRWPYRRHCYGTRLHSTGGVRPIEDTVVWSDNGKSTDTNPDNDTPDAPSTAPRRPRDQRPVFSASGSSFFALISSITQILSIDSTSIYFNSPFSSSSSFSRLAPARAMSLYLRFKQWKMALEMLCSRQTSSTV